jgi:hypothetical protein
MIWRVIAVWGVIVLGYFGFLTYLLLDFGPN